MSYASRINIGEPLLVTFSGSTDLLRSKSARSPQHHRWKLCKARKDNRKSNRPRRTLAAPATPSSPRLVDVVRVGLCIAAMRYTTPGKIFFDKTGSPEVARACRVRWPGVLRVLLMTAAVGMPIMGYLFILSDIFRGFNKNLFRPPRNCISATVFNCVKSDVAVVESATSL